jgi:hypothetical protein
VNLHALVLPHDDFSRWLRAADSYVRTFERVHVLPALDTLPPLGRFNSISALANRWGDAEAISQRCPRAVRVDLLAAETPDSLATLLAERVRRHDRFGRETQSDGHLLERFTLALPLEPTRLTRSGDGVALATTAGSPVHAPIDGIVSAIGTGAIELRARGAEEVYRIRCVGVDEVGVRLGAQVSRGTVIGCAAGAWLRLSIERGESGAVDPLPLLQWPDLRLRPTASSVRTRSEPHADSAPLLELRRDDLIEPLEPDGVALAKIGREGKWIHVRTPYGVTGYVAAWLLEAVPSATLPNLIGVNIDPTHPLGQPDPSRLMGLGYVRFVYRAAHFPSPDAADSFYAPLIQAYAAKIKLILALTPQTYGDGDGYVWERLTPERWSDFIPRFAEQARRLGRLYAGKIAAYDLWNAPAPPDISTRLLNETARAIRSADPTAQILASGDVCALRSAQAAGLLLDGITLNAEGYGAPGASPRYAPLGTIDALLAEYAEFEKPLWITSFGVFDKPDDAPAAVARYAVDLAYHIRSQHRTRVTALCWSNWADGLGDGFGLVDRLDRTKYPLFNEYLDA